MILRKVKGLEFTTQKPCRAVVFSAVLLYSGAVLRQVKGRNPGGRPGFLRIITKSRKTVPL